MLGGTGNVTLNVSGVMTEGWDDVRRAAVEFEGSDVGARAVPLIPSNLFGVEGRIGAPRRDSAGRRNLDERKLSRRRSDGMEPN